MKINAIRGKNIASLYGEFDIEFNSEPLAGHDIFAITGATGSGKSSILDAMCLALFGMTPRLPNKRAGIAEYAVIDEGDKTLNLHDPRRLLSKGEKDCYAEVDFTANDGESYRSRWEASRATPRKGQAGKMKDAEMRLSRIVSNTLEESKKSVAELLGMTFDQFCKTVLLSQGEFQKFLEADDDDKADILQKLTGTSIYSTIGSAVHQAQIGASNELTVVNKELGDISTMSEEEVLDANNAIKSYDDSISSNVKESDTSSRKLKWYTDFETASKKYDEAEKEASIANEQFEAAQGRRKRIEDLNALQGIRADFRLWEDKVKTQTYNKEKKKETESKHIEYADKKESLNKIKEKAESAEKSFIGGPYAERKRVVVDARSIEAQLEPAKATRDKDLQAITNVTKIIEKCNDDISLKETALKEKASALKGMTDWLTRNQDKSSIIESFDEISTLLTTYSTKRKNAIDYRNQATTIEEEIKEKTNGKNGLNALTGSFERLKALLPSDVARIQARLKHGEACPVCGSVEHPYEGTEKTESCPQDIDARDEALKTLKEEIDRINSLISTKRGQIETLLINASSSDAEAEKSAERLDPLLACIGDWEAEFEKKDSKTLLQRLTDFKQEWNAQSSEKNEIENKSKTIQAEKEVLENNLKEYRADEVQKKTAYEGSKKKVEELIGKRKELLGELSADEAEKNNESERSEKEKATKEAGEKLAEVDTLISRLEGEIAKLKESIDKTDEESCKLKDGIDRWIAEANNVRAADNALNWDSVKSLFDTYSETWIQGEQDKLNGLKQALRDSNLRCEERKKAMAELQDSKDRPSEDESKESLLQSKKALDEAKGKLESDKTNLMAKLKQDRENKRLHSEMLSKMQEKTEALKNWNILDELFGKNDGNKFKRLAQTYTLEKLVGHANIQLRKFTDRYELIKDENAKRIDSLSLLVIDKYDGNVKRVTTTLSGGEKFIVSLSLALGLSSLTSDRMSVGSLFIDEGFGSLDSESLNIVMDALERMRESGHRIGLISHVQEINQRIPAQIKVKKVGGGRSKITIQG
jgi:exonuclease SbcC